MKFNILIEHNHEDNHDMIMNTNRSIIETLQLILGFLFAFGNHITLIFIFNSGNYPKGPQYLAAILIAVFWYTTQRSIFRWAEKNGGQPINITKAIFLTNLPLIQVGQFFLMALGSKIAAMTLSSPLQLVHLLRSMSKTRLSSMQVFHI